MIRGLVERRLSNYDKSPETSSLHQTCPPSLPPSVPLHLGLDVLDLIKRDQADITTEGGMGRDLIKAPTGAFHLEREGGREGRTDGGRKI